MSDIANKQPMGDETLNIQVITEPWQIQNILNLLGKIMTQIEFNLIHFMQITPRVHCFQSQIYCNLFL